MSTIHSPDLYFVSRDELDELDLKIDLVITGPTTGKVFGRELAEKFDAKLIIVNGDRRTIENLSELISGLDETYEIVAGVGGGAIIDCSKYFASELDINLFAFPTALSHDGIASNRSSLHYNGEKASIKTIRPNKVIGIREVLEKNPMNVGGIGDLLSNYSSVSDWLLSSRHNNETVDSEAYNKIMESLSFSSEEGLFSALTASGVAINLADSSRPASGGEHTIYHALSETGDYGSRHGELVALFGLFNLGLFEKFEEQSIIDWDNYRQKLEEYKLPTTLEQVGISYSDFESAVIRAQTIRDRYGAISLLNGDNTKSTIYSVTERVGLVR
ncbi:MAG: iron-containing alcohol dehydrogenase [Candidatus Altiarchaeota archaeon]|nr:iron-containing alcohol dehydrogenase [Candidatus Altiarchaeota archaeon]